MAGRKYAFPIVSFLFDSSSVILAISAILIPLYLIKVHLIYSIQDEKYISYNIHYAGIGYVTIIRTESNRRENY